MNFVDKTSVLIIQRKLIDRYGGIHGLRDESSLESAINAAENRFNYETDDLAKLAATYAYHLSQAHAFLDGNKRIAAAVAGIFLLINGAFLNADESEIIDLFMRVADGKLSRNDVESKFQQRLGLDLTSK